MRFPSNQHFFKNAAEAKIDVGSFTPSSLIFPINSARRTKAPGLNPEFKKRRSTRKIKKNISPAKLPVFESSTTLRF
jgi:hypothetical protein